MQRKDWGAVMSTKRGRPLLLHGRGDTRFNFIVRGEPFDMFVVRAATDRGRPTRTIRMQEAPPLVGEQIILGARALPVTLHSEILVSGVTDPRIDFFSFDTKLSRELLDRVYEEISGSSIVGRHIVAHVDFHPVVRNFINLEGCTPSKPSLGGVDDVAALVRELHRGQKIKFQEEPDEDHEPTEEELAAFWEREIGFDPRNRYRTK